MRKFETKREGNRIKLAIEKTTEKGKFIGYNLSESEAAMLYMKLKLMFNDDKG